VQRYGILVWIVGTLPELARIVDLADLSEALGRLSSVYGQPVTRNAVIGLVIIAILVALIVLLTLTHASPS
jgi:hypothetical protein